MKNYECKVILDRTMENGMTKKVTEQYIIQDCLSLSESESRMSEYIAPYAIGDFEVISSRVDPYHEIVYDKFGIVSQADGEAQKLLGQNRNASTDPDRWYRVKVSLITLDEKSGRKKTHRSQPAGQRVQCKRRARRHGGTHERLHVRLRNQ